MDLKRDEIAVRKIYESLVKDKKITVFFRPGNRLCPNYRCYFLDEIITLRIIEVLGNDNLKIPPKFNSFKQKIKIIKIDIKKISEFKKKDFVGSSPDVFDIISLKYHLGLIYNSSIDSFDEVSRIEFEYLD